MSVSQQSERINAAVCLIGTELVRGIIQDGHARLISSRLTSLGIKVESISMIPDDAGIDDFLYFWRGKVDMILTTGGLGPTSDDITRDAVADAAGVPLVDHQEAKAALERRISRNASQANLRQVLIPQGFDWIHNPEGTAPGFCGPLSCTDTGAGTRKRTMVYAMPGPPREMQPMFIDQVIPRICERFLEADAFEERLESSVFLIPESRLEEMCARYAADGISWGTRVQESRISLYLTGGTDDQRKGMLSRLQGHFGKELVNPGDVDPLGAVVETLKDGGFQVAGAESCTGGYIAKLLTDLPGSSSYFWGAQITYAYDAKESLLQIDPALLAEYGAVSEETVRAMVQSLLRETPADVCYAVSGIAGPDGGQPGKPVGTVWVAIGGRNRGIEAVRLDFHAYTRDSVRRRSAYAVLILINRFLKGDTLLDIVAEWQYS